MWALLLLLAQEAAPAFTQFEISRDRGGVDAALVNPFLTDMTGVRITVTFLEGDREVKRSKTAEVPRIPAGQTAKVKIEAALVPAFDRYELVLEFGDKKRLAYAGKPPSLPALRPAKAGAFAAEVKGVHWVKGYMVKNHYTGDVAFLKLAFRDAEGKPAQPLGTATVIVYDGEKPHKRVPRNLTRDSYKVNTAKITPDTANPEAVAYDPKTGEVWVGLIRTEGTGFIDLRADVTLAIRDQGTWTWKALADPWEAEAKPADKK